MRDPTTATSAPAMARSMTPLDAFGRDPRRSTSRSRRTNSSPTPRSESADGFRLHPAGFDHERTSDLPAAKRIHAMDGAAAADRRAHLFVLRRLSHPAQPQLLVDVRRHPRLHARRADRHGRRAGDALHAAGGLRLQFRRADHARRELRLVSYKDPREVLWILGVIILLLMIIAGFMSYVLPWGQMSFWAATVITNLFSAIPLVGGSIVSWLWGGFAVGNPTLNRFYSLHYLLPFVIAGVVVLHIWALHMVGQNNPTGIEPKSDKDVVAFTPYATIKDAFFMAVFCILFAWFVFYIPNFMGHPDNYIPANPAVTPTHIVPEWYYLPFYAILRAIPNKLFGVIALVASILILAFLPWLDTSKVRSAKYRPLYRQFFWIFVVVCIGLGWLGSKPPEGAYVLLARLFTVYYFAYFLIILPVLGLVEKTKPLPSSISESVLPSKSGAKA